MKIRNKFFLLMALVMISSALFVSPVGATTNASPNIVGEFGVSIDSLSGEVLFDKNANEKAYPASTTKIMTALLLIENIKPGEKIVLSENAIGKDRSNSQIMFSVGEELDRDAALFTMMTISANDIATAIGEHIAGSEEKFGEMMTERAKELGALNTNLVTASGLHDPNHYSTTYDMALITKEAIKSDLILKAMGTKKYEVHTNTQTKEVVNPSQIHSDPDTIGGKTGFTNHARNTLVKIDEIDGKRAINVVMKSNLQNVYKDIKVISNYAISQLETEVVVDKNKWNEKLTFMEKEILIVPEKTITLTKKIGEVSPFTNKFIQTYFPNEEVLYTDGIKANQKIGEIEISKGGLVVEKIGVVSTQDVFFEKKKQVLIPMWLKIILATSIPFILYVAFVVSYNLNSTPHKKETSVRIHTGLCLCYG